MTDEVAKYQKGMKNLQNNQIQFLKKEIEENSTGKNE